MSMAATDALRIGLKRSPARAAGWRARVLTPALAADARRAAVIVAVWTGVAFFTSYNSYLGLRLVGRPMVWADLLAESLASCWIWAAFTPPILWLARRFRVERRRWLAAVLVHVAAGFGFAFLDVVVDAT